jgi:hypothetical protein
MLGVMPGVMPGAALSLDSLCPMVAASEIAAAAAAAAAAALVGGIHMQNRPKIPIDAMIAMAPVTTDAYSIVASVSAVSAFSLSLAFVLSYPACRYFRLPPQRLPSAQENCSKVSCCNTQSSSDVEPFDASPDTPSASPADLPRLP